MVKVYGDLTNHLKSLANDGLKYTYILATGIPTPTVFGILLKAELASRRDIWDSFIPHVRYDWMTRVTSTTPSPLGIVG